MSDRAEIVRFNERIKAFSGLILNLDAISVAALAYRVVDAGRFDLWSALWTLGVAILTYCGVQMLALLEPEG